MDHQPKTNQLETIEIPLTRDRVIELLKRFPDNTKPYVDYIKQLEQEMGRGLREEDEIKILSFS